MRVARRPGKGEGSEAFVQRHATGRAVVVLCKSFWNCVGTRSARADECRNYRQAEGGCGCRVEKCVALSVRLMVGFGSQEVRGVLGTRAALSDEG